MAALSRGLIAALAALVITHGNHLAAQTVDKPLELPAWGKAADPDGDCKFFVAEDALLIMVPGSARPHDLAADIEVTNAPRVLQTVKGDFTLQVQVDGRFAPGEESNKPGRSAYNGAGLVVVVDSKNVITLARAILQWPGREPAPYANFEMRLNGKLIRIGLTNDHPLPSTGPVFLRLERRGQKFLAAVSSDGTTWDELEAKDVPAEWPQEVSVGLVAISTSLEEFTPRFSKYQLLR